MAARRVMIFDIYRDGIGEWRWRLIASNGRIVADSGEGYAAAHGARSAARALMSSAPMAILPRPGERA